MQRRNGFGVSALKKRRKGGDGSVLSLDGFEEEEEKEEDEDGDDEDGIFIPFSQMKDWLQNKPPGFGEGKVYDTSVEDKLFEEMQHSRQAQLANINNLKNNPIEVESKKDHHQQKSGLFVVLFISLYLLFHTYPVIITSLLVCHLFCYKKIGQNLKFP